jgi:hypothetical protein
MTNDITYISRTFDKAVAQQLKAPTVGMTLLPLNTTYSGLGKTSIMGFLYKDRAGSKIGMNIDHNMADTVDIGGDTLKVPVIQDQVKIPRRTYQAYIDNGIPLNQDLAFDMLRNNNKKIDDLVMNGWAFDATTYEIKGLNQIAGTATTGSVTSTYGGGLYSVVTAISDLESAGVVAPAYDIIMYADNYNELKASINSTSGRRELTDVMEALGPGGRVLKAPTSAGYTANTAVLKPAAVESSRQFFELYETVAPMHHAWFVDGNTETGDIMVEQVWCGVPRFKHVSTTDVSVAKITGL